MNMQEMIDAHKARGLTRAQCFESKRTEARMIVTNELELLLSQNDFGRFLESEKIRGSVAICLDLFGGSYATYKYKIYKSERDKRLYVQNTSSDVHTPYNFLEDATDADWDEFKDVLYNL